MALVWIVREETTVEYDVLERLRKSLPSTWKIVVGVTLPDDQRSEVDLVVLGERRIFMLDLKLSNRAAKSANLLGQVRSHARWADRHMLLSAGDEGGRLTPGVIVPDEQFTLGERPPSAGHLVLPISRASDYLERIDRHSPRAYTRTRDAFETMLTSWMKVSFGPFAHMNADLLRCVGLAAIEGNAPSQSPSLIELLRPTADEAQWATYLAAQQALPRVLDLLDPDAEGLGAGEHLDANLWGAPPTTPQVNRAVARQLSLEFEERRALEADSLTRTEVAQLLGKSPQAVTGDLEAGRLAGLKTGKRWLIPAWQLAADSPDGLIPGLADLLRAFPGGPIALTGWVRRSNADLSGRTPREALLQGDRRDVLRAARSLHAVAS